MLVSVLINNYNYGRYLDNAIGSVLAQTYKNIELIVVDDGSTDNSVEVLKKYEDRAKIIFKANGGQASAFNTGVAASTGEIICFLDADDMYAPDKVQKVVDTFNGNPNISYCFDKVVLCNEVMQPLTSEERTGKTHYVDYRARLISGSLRKYMVMEIPATSGLSFKRGLLSKIFPMPESESCSMCENYMKYIAVGDGEGAFLDTSLTLQRIHGKNLFTQTVVDPYMSGRISVLTGFWLYKKFPQFVKFADTQIAFGIMQLKKSSQVDPKYWGFVREYLVSRGLAAASLVCGRSLYYMLKTR